MKTGYVAIVGEPNVGKSTLLNQLLGVKLSIVADKPQTTRNAILGVLTEGDCQFCFLDTPGVIAPAYELQRAMVQAIRLAVEGADIVMLMVDPWFKPGRLAAKPLTLPRRRPIIGVINKIDLVRKLELLPVIQLLRDAGATEVVPVSALTGNGLGLLKEALARHLPEGDFQFPADQLSDRQERFFVAEIVREKVFARFTQEIPYATCVAIDEFRERSGHKDLIRATIYVEKDSQKGIIIGAKGSALKSIGAAARVDIERFLGRPVYLELWVKVRPDWRSDRRFLKELGYE